MKILFVQHQGFINGSGGTEKICSFLANHFCDLGYEVEIATNENKQGKEVFPLNEKISLINIYSNDIEQISLKPVSNYVGKNPFLWLKYKFLKKRNKFLNKKIFKKWGGEREVFIYNLRQRAKVWEKFIKQSKPDVIITMSISSVLEISFENEINIPIINSTNGRPDYDYTNILWYRSTWEQEFLKKSYEKLTAIQVLFENYKDFLPKNFQGKTFVIGNPLPQNVQKTSHYEKNTHKITHIGTLNTSCKQQDLAIRCFAKLAQKYPNWELHFYGVGTDENYLKNLIKENHLENKIFLNGFTNNPLEKLQASDIFVFPSNYEGFPLALGEAMAVGLPSIGMEKCSGVNQMIKHGDNGFLAKNEEEFTIYLEEMMNNSDLRKQLGRGAIAFASGFTPENVAQKWETIINDIKKK